MTKRKASLAWSEIRKRGIRVKDLMDATKAIPGITASELDYEWDTNHGQGGRWVIYKRPREQR